MPENNANPTGQNDQPEHKKISLLKKLRHPFRYRFQVKLVSSEGSQIDDASPVEDKKAQAQQAKKDKADKKAQLKKEKQAKAKEKKAKAKQAKATKAKKSSDKSEKKKIPLPLLIGLIVLLLGGGTTGVILLRSGSSIESRMAKAEKYIASQKYDSAVKIYNEVIIEDDIDASFVVEAYLGLSDAYVGAEDIDAAVSKLETGYDQTGDERIAQRLYQLAPEKEFPEDAEEEDMEALRLPAETPIQFSDRAFESMIRLALGKSEGETIYQKDLDEIRSLKILGDVYAQAGLSSGEVSGTSAVVLHEHDRFLMGDTEYTERGGIRSLDDLVYFHNLTRLSIGYNQISDISGISGVKSLSVVGLYANEISDLSPLQSLDKLQVLYLYNNNIRDLSPVAQLPNLKQLLVQYNNISDLSALQNMTELRELFVSHNDITDLSPLRDLQNLEQLFASGNRIADVSPVSGLGNLKFFYARDNQIADLNPLAKMYALTDIDFSGNPVSDYTPTSGITNVNRPLGRTVPYR